MRVVRRWWRGSGLKPEPGAFIRFEGMTLSSLSAYNVFFPYLPEISRIFLQNTAGDFAIPRVHAILYAEVFFRAR